MKKYVGRLIKIKFKDMGPLVGHIIDYGDDWILMRNCPVDYVVDGYFVVRKKNIKEVVRGEEEKWREKVIGLKKLKGVPKIPLTDLNGILKALTKQYGVFSVHTKDDDVCWLGRLNRIEDKLIVIDDLTPKAKWGGQFKFKESEIRVLEFDSDYVNSLKLLAK
jgi:hypothetical protein